MSDQKSPSEPTDPDALPIDPQRAEELGLLDLPPETDRFVNGLAATFDITKPLYHYCASEVVLSIAQSGTMWASDLRYVNDAQELRIAEREFVSALESWKHVHRNDDMSEFLHIVDGAREMITAEIDRDPVFAVSFSASRDELSQWRAYCPHGRGFAIGITATNLARLVESVPGCWGALLPCAYEPDMQRALFASMLEGTYRQFREIGPLDVGMWVSIIQTRYSILAPMMKARAFSVEREVRLALVGWDNPQVHLRPGRATLIPYVELNLVDADAKVEIAELLVGPTPLPELSVAAAQRIVSRVPIKAVETSTVPYREV